MLIMPSSSDSREVRALTKRSLQKQWKNAMSHDWIPRDKAKTFPLEDFYVELTWTRLVKGAIRNEREPMKSLHEVFNVIGNENEGLHLLVEGNFICQQFLSINRYYLTNILGHFSHWQICMPPGGQNSFYVIQFLGKFGKMLCWRPLEGWRHLLGEILDPTLLAMIY